VNDQAKVKKLEHARKATLTMIQKISIGNGDYNSIDQLLGDSRVCSSHTHSRKMSGKYIDQWKNGFYEK